MDGSYRNLLDAEYEWLFDPYDGDEVVVFDTETTGLNTKKDAILSIGAVKIKGDKILTSQSFEIFLKPSKEISPGEYQDSSYTTMRFGTGFGTIRGGEKIFGIHRKSPIGWVLSRV